MCGRYVLAGAAGDYAEYLGVGRLVTAPLPPSHNVAPTDQVYLAHEEEGTLVLGAARWGVPLVPGRPGGVVINARAETAASKPAFRPAMARRRCLIPADGFYEWEPRERGGGPHWIRRRDGLPLAFAGLWWRHPEGQEPTAGPGGPDLRCAILTSPAHEPVDRVHHRMPVALDPSMWEAWLHPGLTDPHAAATLLLPIPSRLMVTDRVSRAVNDVRNDGPHLLEPDSQPRLW